AAAPGTTRSGPPLGLVVRSPGQDRTSPRSRQALPPSGDPARETPSDPRGALETEGAGQVSRSGPFGVVGHTVGLNALTNRRPPARARAARQRAAGKPRRTGVRWARWDATRSVVTRGRGRRGQRDEGSAVGCWWVSKTRPTLPRHRLALSPKRPPSPCHT